MVKVSVGTLLFLVFIGLTIYTIIYIIDNNF